VSLRLRDISNHEEARAKLSAAGLTEEILSTLAELD
jgi:hypothetical protein